MDHSDIKIPHIALAGIFLALLSGLQATGQNHPLKKSRFKDSNAVMYFKDTFSFRTVRNDPENAANLTLLLSPFYFELYGLNDNMGYDVALKYEPSHNFAFEAGYRGSYFESVQKNNVTDGGSQGGPAVGLSNLKDFYVTGEYEFNNQLDTDIESVKIGRVKSLELTERPYAKYLRQYGIRVGFQYFETYFSGDQIPLSGYYVNDPSKKVISFGNGPLGTMMQENIYNIGASITTTHDLILKNDRLGTSKTQSKTYLYADLMMAPAIAYTNIILKDYENISNQEYTDFNVNSSVLKSRLGFRVGFDYFDISPYGLNFGLETGFRPGPSFMTGLYVLGKFGFSLNAKI